MPAQGPPQDRQFQIEINVAGKAIDDTKAAEKKRKPSGSNCGPGISWSSETPILMRFARDSRKY